MASGFAEVRDYLDTVPILLIPLWQVLVFSVLVAILAILERPRMVLLISYLFSAYWVFVENLKLLAVNQVSVITVLVYLALGITILGLYIYHGNVQGGRHV